MTAPRDTFVWMPAAIFAAGIILAAVAGDWLQRNFENQDRERFNRNSERVIAEITGRFQRAVYGLNSARAIYVANDKVSREQFREFLHVIDLTREFPGVRGFGFIQHIRQDGRDAFVADIRADGAPGFAIRQLEDKTHDDLYVIKRVEPVMMNVNAEGLDIGSEARRRAGIQRAIDTGHPTLSASIELVQDKGKTAGTLLFVPVYRGGTDPDTVEQRRAALVGVIFAPIVYVELLHRLTEVELGQVDFELFDAAGSTHEKDKIYDADNHVARSRTDGNAVMGKKFSVTQTLPLPGRNFTLRVNSGAVFEAASVSVLPQIAFAVLTLISALLAGLLWQQAIGRRNAEALAQDMTVDLERLAQVARCTSNAVIITDTTRRITWVNDGFERITGYSAAEVIGLSPGKLLQFEGTDRDAIARLREALDARRTFSGELLNRGKQGREYWLDLEIKPTAGPDGEWTGFMAIESDISERKQAEFERQRSDVLLRGAMEAMDEGFVLFDAADRLVLSNQRYRDMSSLSTELLVPGITYEAMLRADAERGLYLQPGESRDDWVNHRLVSHGMQSSQFTQRLADGRTMRVNERQMINGYTVSLFSDISDMICVADEANAASHAKSQFLANMSHEIRTPMNAVLGMLSLLGKTALTARQSDYTTKAESAARALLGLLNEILDFSKIEAGKMTLDPQPFRIDRLLRDLSVILAANLGPKKLEVLFDIDPALPRHLVGDEMRLKQILTNLSGNALKFTAEGEVVVSLKVVQRDAACVTVEFAVRDTGIGVAPENQARIFSGFTQAEASTTRRFGGTGLGVAISQRFVALMGGELRLDSALGRGSRFYFSVTLPVAAEAIDDSSEVPASMASLRVLVVDDNPAACHLLQRMCQSFGWSVDGANCGEQALALLQSRDAAGVQYDIVFVDWEMPGLNGWETSRRIGEMGLSGTPPSIVMVTAHGQEMLMQSSEADQALLGGFLVKPVTASMLYDAVIDARGGIEQSHRSRSAVGPGGKRLAGMRLLVAEDNLNNQQVACELLECEGATVQIANHGQEAVDAVAAADPPFDVVLMDLQMPVMDGFAATSLIRQKHGTGLPIVAMTANAMASDREACLAVGMNDHVGKPFDLDHLVRVLHKHAGRREALADADPAPEAPLPAAVAHAAAAAGVDIAAAVNRMGGNLGLYQRMLGHFVKALSALPEQLSGQVAQGDAVSAMRLLHTVKGQAATLGAMALSVEAAGGEKMFAAGPAPTDAEAFAQQFACAVAAVSGGLETLLRTLHAADAPAAALTAALDSEAVLKQLRIIQQHLQNADMAATDAMTGLRRQPSGALEGDFKALDDAISALDFERALPQCNALIDKMKEGQPA